LPTTIGREYTTSSKVPHGAEEDLLSPEVASSLSEKWKTSASKDVCEKRAARVLNASLAAASEKIFHISVMPSLSGKNATSTNHPQQVLHVYCNSHLSQALRHGGNVNMFAIVVLKIMAAYGLSLPDAIQRARSTYYFNNLVARSVVVDFLQELKENIDGLKNFGKLSYFDVHSFLNPDALKKLICILYSKLPGGEIVDPTNDREQLNAWRTCINLASKTNASELDLWPETIKCSLLRLIGIFTSATYECFGSKGKSWQYDFREFGSIAQLSWYINLTMGIRNARNEITTKDIDTSADEEAKKERLSVKLKLAKFASAKKYEKRKAEREKTSDDDSRVLNIVFPPRQVDLANRINGCSLVGTLCDGERAMKKVYYVPGFWPVCRGKPCCEPCNRWLTRKCILCRFKNLDVADVVKVEYGALKGASLCEGCFDEYAKTIAWPALNTEDCAKLRKKETKAVENICKTCGKHAQMVTQELQFCHNCVDFFEHGNCLYWTKELRDRFNPKGNPASCYEDLSFAEGNQDIVTLKRGKSKGGKGSKSKAYLMVHRGGEWISANDLHLQEK